MLLPLQVYIFGGMFAPQLMTIPNLIGFFTNFKTKKNGYTAGKRPQQKQTMRLKLYLTFSIDFYLKPLFPFPLPLPLGE